MTDVRLASNPASTRGRIDADVLNARVASFVGYGNANARYWFVGLEEGCGPSDEEIGKRFAVWHAWGGRRFEELKDYHDAVGINALFGPTGKAQATWRRLIQLYLAMKGLPSANDDALRYQRHDLSRPDCEICLAELMPFPERGTSSWRYPTWTAVPECQTRAGYMRKYAPSRVKLLRELLDQYHPRLVVLYGTTCMREWNELTYHRLAPVDGILRARTTTLGRSTVYEVPHPGARGLAKDYFVSLGRYIRDTGLAG